MIVHRELKIEDYKGILLRRKWMLVIPAAICLVLAYIAAAVLPKKYLSETVVLVEQPGSITTIVNPTMVNGDVNQRLATMQEQILSRTRLQQIIDRFGLYKDDTTRSTREDQIVRLRKSITVSPVRPMAETRANGLPGFTVSVVASKPELAQNICNEITSFFMKQNDVIRMDQAESRTKFLTEQLNEAKAKLDEQDAKLAAFQRQNMGILPDETQTNFSLLSTMASQLEATSLALSRAQQDKVFVESTLSTQLAAAKVSAGGTSPDALQLQLSTLQDQLAGLESRYTQEYPDVIKVKNQIAQLEKRIREQVPAGSTQAANASDKDAVSLETPQIRQLRAQLFQIDQTIRERTAEQARLQRDISTLQGKLQLSPAIAQQYKALTRDSQTALTIYNGLLKQQSDSEMASDLERKQQGEQFRVLDPPNLPQKPSFPNKLLFTFGGLFGGLALGAGLVAYIEVQDTAFRTERDIEVVLKLPTLAMVPVVKPSRPGRGNGSNGKNKKAAEIRPSAEPVGSSLGIS